MAEVIIDNSNASRHIAGHDLKMQCPSPSSPAPEPDHLLMTATASVVVPVHSDSNSNSNDSETSNSCNDIKRHYNNNNNIDDRVPIVENSATATVLRTHNDVEITDNQPEQMIVDDTNDAQERERERVVVDDGGCDEDETASSCGSEPGNGRLQIVLNNNNNNNTISKRVTDNEDDNPAGTRREVDAEQNDDNMEHDGRGEGDGEGEYDEDFYERYRQQQQQLYHQLNQQQQKQLLLQQQYNKYNLQEPNSAAASGLTVTKFPINGHAQRGGSFNGKHATGGTVTNNARITSSPEPGQGLSGQHSSSHMSNGLNLNMKEGRTSSPNSRSVAELMNGYAHQSHHYNKYSQMLLQQDLDLRRQESSHHASRRSHGSSRHGHHHCSGGGNGIGHGHGHEPYNIIKSEKRSGSQSSSPPQHQQTQFLNDAVKPENLATGSQQLPLLSSPSPNTALSRSLSNALLNLASLGNLAALQQTQAIQSNSTNNGPSTMSTPLNLTNNHNGPRSLTPNTILSNLTGAASMHLPRSSSPPSSLSPSHYLAQLISQHQQLSLQQQQTAAAAAAAAASSPSPSLLNPNPTNMPQLILASGNIVQGIQGAQLLIPSPQGLMTQTILTIPISSPGSPPSSLPSPPIPNSLSSSSSSRRNNGHHGSHAHRQHSASPHPKLHVPPSMPPRSPSPSTLPVPSVSSRGSASPNESPLLNLAAPSSSHLNLVNRHHARVSAAEQLASRASPGPAPNQQLNSNFVSDRQSGSTIDRHAHGGHQSTAIVNGPSAKREPSSTAVPANQLISSLIPVNSPGGRSSVFGQSKLSPNSLAMLMEQNEDEERLDEEGRESDYDKCSFSDDDDDDGEMIEGINLDEIKEFAKAFKLRRLSLGLTQTQVGQALSVTEGPSYSQSAICSALAWQLAQSQSQSQQLQANRNRSGNPQSSVMFEKLDITPKSAQKIKPVLERWMKEAEDRYRNGHQNLNDFVGMEPSKKRKRRTSFTPQALEILNVHFERNTHPSGAEITTLAHQLGYEREVIRIWFCNKRQALKNTVRLMTKGGSPM